MNTANINQPNTQIEDGGWVRSGMAGGKCINILMHKYFCALQRFPR